ncbi:alpha/beta fold hydrolase [Kitasatospora sp. NBC_00458]|uniref:alpha/beta fold hydrolase n=1 Tax=Kitasatospora sp. NBC_00458 TaxID=2903568 RepID=UPI002E181140
MHTFPAPDGTLLAYRVEGDADGDPVVCLPGGPMQDSRYLGDLGGLAARAGRRLVLLDLRGTGASAVPADTGTYRCDRLVDDVEALRVHLGLDRLDLLGHSAGAGLAVRYTERHPERVGRLALVTPSVTALGVTIDGETRRETARLHRGEPWFAEAYAALETITSGHGGPADWSAIAPFMYGRWDDQARLHQAAEDTQRNDAAAAVFASEGAFDPPATRSALAARAVPALVLAGEVDLSTPPKAAAEMAGLLPGAVFAVQPGAGHFPWLDDAELFTAAVGGFLA